MVSVGQRIIHKCQDCGRMFNTEEFLEAHMNSEHHGPIDLHDTLAVADDVVAEGNDEVIDPEVVVVEEAETVGTEDDVLTGDIESSGVPEAVPQIDEKTCPICLKNMSSKSNVQRHMKTIHAEVIWETSCTFALNFML